MDVVSLLKSKNRCLERCLDLSIRFLADTETGDLAALPSFETRRAAVFKVIDLYDRKITEAVSALPLGERTTELADRVRDELARGEAIAQKVIEADNRIMERIELEKRRLLAELRASDRSRAMIGKFKSGWVPDAGEGIDRKL